MTASTIQQQQQQRPSTIFGSSSPQSQSTTMSMLPSPPVVVSGDSKEDNGKIVSFDWSDLLVLQGSNDDDTNYYYYNRDDADDDDDEASFFGSNNKDFHFDGNGITPPTPSIIMDLDKDDRMLPPRSLPYRAPPPSFESPCEQDHPPMMMMKKTTMDTLYYSPSFLNNNEPQQLPPLAFQKRYPLLKKNKTTKIRFASKVSIRTYNMIVSDHPCCLSGLALEFGWEHEDHSGELPTEEAELYRCRCRCPRRRSYQERREYLLTYCHYTNTELDDLLVRQRQERSLRTAQTSPLWSSTREQQRRKRREQRRLHHTKGMTSEMMED